MQPVFILNAYIGSLLIIIFIFTECITRYTSDHIQKKLFCSLIVLTFVIVIMDYLYYALYQIPGKNIRTLLYLSGSLFFIFRILAYFNIFLLADYVLLKNEKRLKKMISAALIINGLHLVLQLINFKWPFLFYIDITDNTYHLGSLFFICMILSYCPMLFATCEVFILRKSYKRYTFVIIIVLLFLLLVGIFTDIYIDYAKFLWPFITAGLLYFYFYIVQYDTKIDSLTGIGNRYSFNEFTDKLSRNKSGESWAIVMIDMDHFKSINDKFGHLEGDNALRDMASIIKSSLRPHDFAARYGGDEFVLATRVENGIADLIGRIKTEAAKINEQNLKPYKIEISYGFDIYTADGSKPISEFLNHIDDLMYKQKEKNRRAEDKKGMAPAAGGAS